MRRGCCPVGFSVLLLAVIALSASCATARTGLTRYRTADLLGMVYGGDRQPIGGVTIVIDASADASKTQKFTTDDDGRFVVPDLSLEGHTVLLSHAGMESVTVQFQFLRPGQVLYAVLFSVHDLLSRAVVAIQKRDLESARNYIRRASAINADSAEVRFALACLDIAAGKISSAKSVLVALVSNGSVPAEVYLSLARTYAYGDSDIARALKVLERARSFDLDARIEALVTVLRRLAGGAKG